MRFCPSHVCSFGKTKHPQQCTPYLRAQEIDAWHRQQQEHRNLRRWRRSFLPRRRRRKTAQALADAYYGGERIWARWRRALARRRGRRQWEGVRGDMYVWMDVGVLGVGVVWARRCMMTFHH